ncbi:hypothetical protein [Segatella copri]|nr:hypothetical protein [Segatella copri]WOG30699.1 hypothetical protein RJT04_09720 [Segatella copri]
MVGILGLGIGYGPSRWGGIGGANTALQGGYILPSEEEGLVRGGAPFG